MDYSQPISKELQGKLERAYCLETRPYNQAGKWWKPNEEWLLRRFRGTSCLWISGAKTLLKHFFVALLGLYAKYHSIQERRIGIMVCRLNLHEWRSTSAPHFQSFQAPTPRPSPILRRCLMIAWWFSWSNMVELRIAKHLSFCRQCCVCSWSLAWTVEVWRRHLRRMQNMHEYAASELPEVNELLSLSNPIFHPFSSSFILIPTCSDWCSPAGYCRKQRCQSVRVSAPAL